MKYVLSFFVLAFLALSIPATAQVDAISKYFDKYVEDERFTVVYISPKMFQLFDKMDINLEDDEAQAIKEVVRDLKSLRILVAESDAKTLYEEAMKMINTKEYEVLMNVRDKGADRVDFLVKESSEADIGELLLVVGGQDEFVLMSFVGNINIDKIGEMANAFGDDKKEAKDDGDGQE